jgi:hypothetical protein
MRTIRTERAMRLVQAATLALFIAACSTGGDSSGSDSSTPSTASSSSGDDLQDVQNYKLSMEKVDKFYAAQHNMATAFRNMSPAERQLLESDSTDDSGGSLDKMARNFEKVPAVRDAIEDAGLSTREFAVLTMSMIQTGMAASILEMRPNDNQDSLVREMQANMDNIKFYREHKAEIDAKQQAAQKEMEALGNAG